MSRAVEAPLRRLHPRSHRPGTRSLWSSPAASHRHRRLAARATRGGSAQRAAMHAARAGCCREMMERGSCEASCLPSKVRHLAMAVALHLGFRFTHACGASANACVLNICERADRAQWQTPVLRRDAESRAPSQELECKRNGGVLAPCAQPHAAASPRCGSCEASLETWPEARSISTRPALARARLLVARFPSPHCPRLRARIKSAEVSIHR